MMGSRYLVVGLCMLVCAHLVKGHDPNACGPSNLNALSGTIQSPNFPNNYDNSGFCIWTIQVPEGKRLALHFTTFDLEDSESCHNDKVLIHDLSPTPDVVLCGSGQQDDVIGSWNKFNVLFISNPTITGPGFQIEYRTFDKDPVDPNANLISAACSSQGDLGNWRQAQDDDYDWAIGQKGVKIEATYRHQFGKAQLVSPEFPWGGCMQFVYRVTGDPDNHLRVFKRTTAGDDLIWHRDGDQGNVQRLAKIDLPIGNEEYSLVIEGQQGRSYQTGLLELENLSFAC